MVLPTAHSGPGLLPQDGRWPGGREGKGGGDCPAGGHSAAASGFISSTPVTTALRRLKGCLSCHHAMEPL
eukprot:1161634-Pelagomonas_calceolata.AAC.4